jgi:hypothetical protein
MPMTRQAGDPLLPPLHEIHRRLTINARERHRLRMLLKLAIEAQEDAERQGVRPAAREPAGQGEPDEPA